MNYLNNELIKLNNFQFVLFEQKKNVPFEHPVETSSFHKQNIIISSQYLPCKYNKRFEKFLFILAPYVFRQFFLLKHCAKDGLLFIFD